MNRKKVLSIALTITFILSGLSIVDYGHSPTNTPESNPRAHTQTADLYPNSAWLYLWQGPNLSDPDMPGLRNDFPANGTTTPMAAAQYWGSNTFVLFPPSHPYVVGNHTGRNYSWAQIDDSNFWPAGSTLWINVIPAPENGVSVADELADALDIASHSLTNSRIVGLWWGDFLMDISPARLAAVYNGIHAINPALKVALDLWSYGNGTRQDYYDRSNYTWLQRLPYFDELWYGSLWYPDYSQQGQTAIALYDMVQDVSVLVPGKPIRINMLNYWCDLGVNTWDFMAQTLSTTAQLYRQGIVAGVTMLGTYMDNWNGLSSNYMRNFYNSEFDHVVSSHIELSTGNITATVDGIPTLAPTIIGFGLLRSNNWTFTSLRTQTIHFTGLAGSALTVRNLRTGDIYTALGTSFIAAIGEKYHVYNWPHTTLHWINHWINTTTVLSDKLITINGTLHVDNNLTLNNCVVQFGTGYPHPYKNVYYNDTITPGFADRTITWGVIWNLNNPPWTGLTSYHYNIQNTTFEPVNRLFPYTWSSLCSDLSVVRTTWNIGNSTLAGWSDTTSFWGWIHANDNIFFNGVPILGSEAGIGIRGDLWNQQHWTRNLFWQVDEEGTRNVFMMTGDTGQSGYQGNFGFIHFDNNTVVGGHYGALSVGVGWGPHPMPIVLANNQIYPSDYNATSDDYGVYQWPSPWHRLWGAEGGCVQHQSQFIPIVWRDDLATGDTDITITARFYMTTDIAVTGTLYDSGGGPIGTYSNVGGVVSASNIPLMKRSGLATIPFHPFPWTFHITSALPGGYYYAVTSLGDFGVNRTLRQAPYFLPFENDTFEIQAEDSVNLHLERIAQQLLDNGPQYLSGLNMHLGNRVMGWNPQQYVAPQQINMTAVGGTGTQMINVTLWDPQASSGDAITWTTNGLGSVHYDIAGLVPGKMYSISVGGTYLLMTVTAGTNGTLSFSRTSASSSLQEFVIAVSPIDALISMFPMIIGIMIIVGVISMVIGLVGTTGGRKK